MIMKDFSGGLFTRAHPSLISSTESQEYMNCDNEAGILKSIKEIQSTSIVSKAWFKWYENAMILMSFDDPTSFVEYKIAMFYTNNGQLYESLNGTTTSPVGVEGPTNALTGVVEHTPFNISGDVRYIITTQDMDTDTFGYIRNVLYINNLDQSKVFLYTSSPVRPESNHRIIYRWSSTTEKYHVLTGLYPGVNEYEDNIHDDQLIIQAEFRWDDLNSSLEKLPEIKAQPYYSEDNLTGTYTYTYTYYNSSTGYESSPAPLSDSFETARQYIVINGIESSDDVRIDKIRLYRIGGTMKNYTMVTELTNIIGGPDLSYTDNNKDEDIAGNYVLDNFEDVMPPDGLQYLTGAYSILFGAVENKLYFSNIDAYSTWPSTNFIYFDLAITGIAPVQNGVLVFTQHHTYIIAGNSPTTFTKHLLSAEQGCINHYSIAFVDNTVAWLSEDGVCTSNGGAITVLTFAKLGKYSTNSVNSIVHDKVYYLASTDGILAIDFRYNTCIRKLDTIGHLGRFNDIVYIKKEGETTLHELHGSNTPRQLSYKSPLITLGKLSELKVFKDFYISYSGDITIEIFIDDTSVYQKTLDPVKTQHNIKSLGVKDGYGLYFTIVGKGELYEMEFTAQGRSNGK